MGGDAEARDTEQSEYNTRESVNEWGEGENTAGEAQETKHQSEQPWG